MKGEGKPPAKNTMPRYLRVMDTEVAGIVGNAKTFWENVDDLGLGSASSLALETPTGVVNGSNTAFTFSGPPVLVFRNGVMERRLGSIAGNVFTFDSAPETGDDIEGLV